MGLTFLLRKVWRHSLWPFIPGSPSVLSMEDKVSHFDVPSSQGASELGFDGSSKVIKDQDPGRGEAMRGRGTRLSPPRAPLC